MRKMIYHLQETQKYHKIEKNLLPYWPEQNLLLCLCWQMMSWRWDYGKWRGFISEIHSVQAGACPIAACASRLFFDWRHYKRAACYFWRLSAQTDPTRSRDADPNRRVAEATGTGSTGLAGCFGDRGLYGLGNLPEKDGGFYLAAGDQSGKVRISR